MKKKYLILIIIAVVLAIAAIFTIKIKNASNIEQTNLIELRNHISTLSNGEYDLKDITTFDWDYAFNFEPFYLEKDMAEVMGFDVINRLKLKPTINEGTQQLVFVKDNKLVCYVYGYSDKVGIRFNIGYGADGYVKLQNTDTNLFSIYNQENIKYLDYKNQ